MPRGMAGVRGVAHAILQERYGGHCGLSILQADPAETVRQLGVARLPKLLPTQSALDLREFILDELTRRRAEPISSRFQWFTPGIHQVVRKIGSPQSRWDLRLSLAPVVKEALQLILTSELGSALKSLTGVCDPELWELAAAVTAPGAPPQVLHCDTTFTAHPCLFTVFIALQDITRSMGPTRFVLRTHEEKMHKTVLESAPHHLGEFDSVLGLLNTGEASLYDSRVMHGGCTNRSSHARVLLTISFRHPKASTLADRMETRSILPAYKQLHLSLDSLLC